VLSFHPCFFAQVHHESSQAQRSAGSSADVLFEFSAIDLDIS
jgi:hypothetical protein